MRTTFPIASLGEPFKLGSPAIKKHGLTELKSRRRRDTGQPRKVSPEQLLEAIETVKPLFREPAAAYPCYVLMKTLSL